MEIINDNRKSILLISFLRKFVTIFFSLFLNIYILKLTNNNLNFIMGYTLVNTVATMLFVILIMKLVNSKNALYIYKFSFLLLLISIGLLILFKGKIINYIYAFQILYALSSALYSSVYELTVIDSNNKKTMSVFVANIFLLSSIAAIIAPIFSGFIISKFSYTMLFIILMIISLIIIFISLSIKKIDIGDNKLDLKKFINILKTKQHLKDIYKSMFFKRISSQGAIIFLLPIILFARLKTEINLGSYASLFAVLSIISLQLLKISKNKQFKIENTYLYMAISIFISSVFVVFNASFITLLIYYVLINTFGDIIESESCSGAYSAIRNADTNNYKREHIIILNIYLLIGQIISYIIVFLMYNYFKTVNILSIIIVVLMFFLIISVKYLVNTLRYLNDK